MFDTNIEAWYTVQLEIKIVRSTTMMDRNTCT